jgi:PhnB protein
MANSVSTGKKVETTVTTMIYVRRSAAAVDFYTRAFGAIPLSRLDSEDGSVIAHLAVGKGDFWVAEESPAHQNFSPETLGGSTLHIVLVVDDPHAVFDQAIATGASSVCPVRDEEYGWRIGRVLDPFGHHWEIGKVLSGG